MPSNYKRNIVLLRIWYWSQCCLDNCSRSVNQSSQTEKHVVQIFSHLLTWWWHSRFFKIFQSCRKWKWNLNWVTYFRLHQVVYYQVVYYVFRSRFVYLINYLYFIFNSSLIHGELCECDVNHMWNAVTSFV